MGVSIRTGKSVKPTKNSTLQDHMLDCDNKVSFEDFAVVTNDSIVFRTKFQESFLVYRDEPWLNKASELAPLMVFS